MFARHDDPSGNVGQQAQPAATQSSGNHQQSNQNHIDFEVSCKAGANPGNSLLGRHAKESPRGAISSSALPASLAPDFGFEGTLATEFVAVADLRSAVGTEHLFPLFGEYGGRAAEVP